MRQGYSIREPNFNNSIVSTSAIPEVKIDEKVLFRATHWLRFWAYLQRVEDQEIIKETCRRIEVASMQFFSYFGWSFTNMITY